MPQAPFAPIACAKIWVPRWPARRRTIKQTKNWDSYSRGGLDCNSRQRNILLLSNLRRNPRNDRDGVLDGYREQG